MAFDPSQLIISLPPLFFAITAHEYAHGYVANKLGDPTAKDQGRLTMNPIPHIDPIMTILVPAMLIFANSPIVFGGAKPVPVNMSYFRNPLKGMVLVALAGPLMNIFIAGVAILLFKLTIITGFMSPDIISASPTKNIISLWILQSILINPILAVFNMIPIPPLDGGRIAVGLLPYDLSRKVAALEPHGFFIVIILLYLGVVDKFVISPTLQLITNIISAI